MMWLIGYAIFGLVAGAVARLIHPGRDPMNWLWTMILGVAGAELGGWLVGMLGFDAKSGLMHWVAAIAGAILLLVGYHMATAPAAVRANGGPATSDDYKKAVFDDLSRGPNG